MNKNKTNKNLKFVFCSIIIFLLSVASIVYASDESGKIKLSKTATKIDQNLDDSNLEYGRISKVTLNVDANPYTETTVTNGKLDVVLILDTSGSMDYGEGGIWDKNTPKRLTSVKEASTKFINDIMENSDVKLGVVTFAKRAKSNDMTFSKDTATGYLDNLKANGGTNMDDAIQKANSLLSQGRADAKKIVVFLTDGIPTFYNCVKSDHVCGSGNSDAYYLESYNESYKPSDRAKVALDDLKKNYMNADVYTITFGKEEEATKTLAKINPASTTTAHLYENTNSLNADALNKKFENITSTSKNVIGKNAVVTDIIPNTFRLTASSRTTLENNGVRITTNNNGEQILTWNVGTIEANHLTSLSYYVEAKDEYHGSMYTNRSATLTADVDENNTYYNETKVSLDFDRPSVEIPAITVNDSYKNNSSYVTKEGNTVNGNSILNNDTNKKIIFENSSIDSHTTVTDKIEVIENEKVKKITNNTYEVYKDNTKYGELVINADGTFKFNSIIGKTGEVSFDYRINSTLTGYKETPNVYSNTSTVTLNITPIEKISISGTKTWNDDSNRDNIRPSAITVNLYADGTKIDSQEVTSATNWTYTFNNLYKEKYDKAITYTINEEDVKDYTKEINGYDITNTHELDKTHVTGKKVWKDDDDKDGLRPESITVNLLANGSKIASKKVTGNSTSNEWTYTFTNLLKNENGKEIAYTVEEENVLNYETEIEESTITNIHKPTKISVSGKKTWNDSNNNDGKRPESITVRLLKNGNIVDTKTVTSEDNWTYEFTDLYKYSNKKEITYTVKEDEVKGYTTEINGLDITNTHINETTEVTGTKTWNDSDNNDNKRPNSITINLYKNGNYYKSKEIFGDMKSNNWTYSFDNLPKYEDGTEIKYSVDEEDVKGYTKEIKDFDITNTHELETTEVSGTKTWKDSDNNDNKRPNSITINLYKNGNYYKSKEIFGDMKSNNWTYSFDNLPKYEDGTEIKYSVDEEDVKGYTKEIKDFDITNTHELETTEVSGTKTWNDSNNNDGKRPESITVRLLKNGNYYKSKEIFGDMKSNNWTYLFDNLPKYEDGTEIKYSVDEEDVKGYTKEIKDFDITNTHELETTEVSGTKTWNDSNNNDGKRPESITVRLLKNGNIVDTKTVTENDNWEYKFKDLPKYEDGTEIKYSVDEEDVKGYTTEINGLDITNTHKLETTEVTGAKTWNDDKNRDGLRPESITVRLLANGKQTDYKKVVTAEDNWKYEFTNLPKYENGKEISYQVTEDAVEDYTGTVTGNNIENTHNPIKTKINGTKTWIDNNNDDGLRPESIIVRLFANNKEIDSRKVTADNNWGYSFTDLYKYEAGKEIDYSIKEDTVEHYKTTIDGYNLVNTQDTKNITVSGKKTWVNEINDFENPTSITVNLHGKIGEKEIVTKSLEVSEESNWKYEFTNLAEYGEGQLIDYTVSEDAVKDYDTEINGYDIKNTYNPETIEISGTKTWNDDDNRDGLRPEAITIKLTGTAFGKEVITKSLEVTKTDNWNYKFENLPKYNNGQEINYELTEVDVEGYEKNITGYDITNIHTPEKVSFNVQKVWNDFDNNDGLRPETITVKLFANGEVIQTATISKENNWTYKFDNLNKYENGQAINYEIVEDEVKCYTTNYTKEETDNNETSVTITNSHELETTDIKVTKNWDDFNNKYNKRPTSVTINVYANGEFLKTIELTEENNWEEVLKELSKYKNGKLIEYTFEEEKVDDYEAIYNGSAITNKLTYQPKTEVTNMNYFEELPPHTGINNNYINLEYLLFLFLGLVISLKKVLE